MNDHQRPADLDEARLDRAIRSVLVDLVAAAPARAGQPVAPRSRPAPAPRRGRRWVVAAAALTAAAGVLGIVVATLDRDDPPTIADPRVPHATTAPTPAAAGAVAGTVVGAQPGTQPGGTAAVAPLLPNQSASPCGAAAIPADAADVQTIHGDIDGDTVDDTVTLYSIGGAWHVNATSSVKGWASDTAVTTDVHDSMAVSFEDVDYSAGAPTPPPKAVMVTGTGANSDGILADFTFLTNTSRYCIGQWTYTPPDRPTEPFQWVARHEPGHVTGMICEGAAGSRYYTLVDSKQRSDGTWHVITRLLEHRFTTAEITFQPEQELPDSPDFTSQYGDIVGCDHPEVS